MRLPLTCVCLLVGLGIWFASAAAAAPAGEANRLRLVPFPKRVTLTDGAFELGRTLALQRASGVPDTAAALIAAELQRAGMPAPSLARLATDAWSLRLAGQPSDECWAPTFREGAEEEDYQLRIERDAITCCGRGAAGLFYAVQTLCQLIRANRDGTQLPCLVIEDWPALRWRCTQDDLTRGPSSTLDTLRRGVELGASLKLNMWTYYMEYQYAFAKHPDIGPPDGSLEPAELQALVALAKTQHTEVLGNQQSFGHFGWILRKPAYAALGENGSVLCPVNEQTYELLDEMYSDVCPLLPFEMFNVCCDETWGLGEGPSKELAQQIGTGGVYVRHIRRVHDLLKTKYGKRMMMWGDIILQHPDKLDQIPKDTVMLTWGYGPQASFEDQILPFKDSGYEFFVCPGISNWSRILPDFGVATTNIGNFVRDGVKHGAIGMLNTDWEDDGEALQGYRWHGHAWGAECAWNASTTTPEDFNRRIGAVLFGEPGDRFGQAIELLAQTHRLPGMQGMNNRRFWEQDFPPQRPPAAVRKSADRLLEVVRPAIEHLETCRRQATVNADLLDAFLHGARRMELIGTRMLDGLEAAQRYAQAGELAPPEALAALEGIERLVRANRDAHAASGREFERLWRADCNPYALDWTMKRYAVTVQWYDDVLDRLAAARQEIEQGRPLPENIGIALPDTFSRRTRPQRTESAPLEATAPWADAESTARLGIVVQAGGVARTELPIELDVALLAELATAPMRAFCATGAGQAEEILVQADPADAAGKVRLTLLVPGPIAAGGEARIHVYLGRANPSPPLASAVTTQAAEDGMHWIENDRIRLLLGPEGAHLYRWEVKALDGRDLTQPGATSWSGFADAGHASRHLTNTLVCTRRGPALVQYRCRDESGLEKTINCFGGTSWVEVILNEPVTYYWDFDNPANFAADGPAPGEYLFSSGQAGHVGNQADGVKAQVKASGANWAVKYHRPGLALGLVSPDQAGSFCLAPGAGAGGVGIENSPPISHFITFGGCLDEPPQTRLENLRQTLAFGNQPQVVLYAVQGH
jgi:hexosaminidase